MASSVRKRQCHPLRETRPKLGPHGAERAPETGTQTQAQRGDTAESVALAVLGLCTQCQCSDLLS